MDCFVCEHVAIIVHLRNTSTLAGELRRGRPLSSGAVLTSLISSEFSPPVETVQQVMAIWRHHVRWFRTSNARLPESAKARHQLSRVPHAYIKRVNLLKIRD